MLHGIFIWGFYIYWDVFLVFLVIMNGGGSLPHPQALGFHPDDVPFEPLSERVVPRNSDPSVVWNILSFAC
jgi:hypothetical protein